MQKGLFIITLLVALMSFSCESAVLMQNQETTAIQPSPTISSAKDNSNKQEEFKKHYWEGLRIEVNGKFPEDTPKAIEEFKKAAEADPQDTSSFWHLIDLYKGLKKYDEAESCYRQIIERDPKDIRAQWGLAGLLVWDSKKI